MDIVWIVLGSLVGLWLVVLGWKTLFPRRCPECRSSDLEHIASIRGTFVQSERSRPALNQYYLCRGCQAHLRQTRGTWHVVEDLEWKRISHGR